jgi:uncharacterized membrane protein
MVDTWKLWLLLPRTLRTFPGDLATVLLLVPVGLLVTVLPGVRETALRLVFGLPLALFLPGYAIMAVLFPERDEPLDKSPETVRESSLQIGQSINGIERFTLSFGMSILFLGLQGIILNFTTWGINPSSVRVATGGLTVVMTIVAAFQRQKRPEEVRFRVPYDQWLEQIRASLTPGESKVLAVNVLLVVSVVMLLSTVAYTVTTSEQDEQFTELYLLTPDENGTYATDSYPETLEQEELRVTVGVGNYEEERTQYVIVVEAQPLSNSSQIVERTELRRIQFSLAHNETWRRNVTLMPSMTGDNLRVQFLLFREEPPSNVTVKRAYRKVHLWLNASSSQSNVMAVQDGSVLHTVTPPHVEEVP